MAFSANDLHVVSRVFAAMLHLDDVMRL